MMRVVPGLCIKDSSKYALRTRGRSNVTPMRYFAAPLQFILLGSKAELWILHIVVLHAMCIIPSFFAFDHDVCNVLALEDGGFDHPRCLDSISKASEISC